MKRGMIFCLICALLLLSASFVSAEEMGPWHYEIENGEVLIYGYYGEEAHVEIPATINGFPVKKIGNSAFLGRELCSVTFPDTLETIGDFSFAHCPNLTEVYIPANVTYIDYGAFTDCESLTGIWVDENSWDYSSDAQGVLYSKNKVELLQVPGSFTGAYTVEEGVIRIGFGAFEGCSGLSSIQLAESVRYIDGYAFCGCTGITELTIPEAVQSIDDTAFEQCSSLTGVYVAGNNRNYASDENGQLYNKDMTQMIYAPAAFAGDYVVPQGVSSIGNNFFADCEGLTSVTIPDGVTAIGHYAFYNCVNLQSVTIPQSVTDIDAYAFQFCENLTTVNIPGAVTHIKWGLFRDCKRLTELPIHDAVTVIDDFAYAECHSLTDIIIPASVTYVGHYAFFDCRGLQNVYFCGDAPEFVNHQGVNGTFAETRATAYYHAGTNGWTAEAMAEAGGYLTWVELEHIVPSGCSECIVCGETAASNISAAPVPEVQLWTQEFVALPVVPEPETPPVDQENETSAVNPEPETLPVNQEPETPSVDQEPETPPVDQEIEEPMEQQSPLELVLLRAEKQADKPNAALRSATEDESAVKDKVIEENPKTGAAILTIVALPALCAASAAVLLIKKKKHD